MWLNLPKPPTAYCSVVIVFSLKENSLLYPWWVVNLPPIRSPEGRHGIFVDISILDYGILKNILKNWLMRCRSFKSINVQILSAHYYACFWFVIRMITSLLWKKHWQHKWFINWGIKEQVLPQAGASVDINSMVIWAGLVNCLAKFHLLSAKEAKGREMINCYWLMQLSLVIAELAKRSPIIIQNSSNPSNRKNLDLRPYDHTTDRTRCYF